MYNVGEKEINYKKSVEIMDKAADIANTGSLDKALPLFIKASEVCPENIKALINTVQCFVYLERFPEAIQYIEKAEHNITTQEKIALNPAERKRLQEYKAMFFTFKGMCLFDKKEYIAALDWINKALSIDPNKQDALEMKKQCDTAINNPHYKVVKEYGKINANSKGYQKAKKHHEKGVELSKLYRHKKALTFFKKAHKMFPKDLDFCLDTGQCLICLERYDELLEFLKKGSEILDELESAEFSGNNHNRLMAYRVQWYVQWAYYYYYYDEDFSLAMENVEKALEIGAGPYINAAYHIKELCEHESYHNRF